MGIGSIDTASSVTERRWLICCAALLGAALLALGNTAGAHAALPDGRGYEMVSPVDKNGADITKTSKASLDGNRVAFYGFTSFADAPANEGANAYVASRGASGWSTTAVSPASSMDGGLEMAAYYDYADFSRDLSTAITPTVNSAAEPFVLNLYRTGLGLSTINVTEATQAGATIANKRYTGRSADASQIFFESTEQFTGDATGGENQVWKWANGEVSLVTRLPDGSIPSSGATIGSGRNFASSPSGVFGGVQPEPTAVSADGSHVFFSTPADEIQPNHQVFARIDGTSTVELSLSQRTGSIGDEPFGATFQGASVDGSKAFFSSADQLTDDATPGGGIYAYDLGDHSLQFITPGSNDPDGVRFEAVAQISADGSAIYFVAKGILVPGQGTAGAHNLYRARDGSVDFIATLGDGDVHDWSFAVVQLDSAAKTSQATPDGRNFIFESRSALTNAPTNGFNQVYQWAASDGSLTCISCQPDGASSGGDASLTADPIDPFAETYGTITGASADNMKPIGQARAITDDGTRVVFETTDSLVPQDSNGVRDVYERVGGRTYMISAGSGLRDSEVVDMTPDGNSIFFMTRDSLVPQDIDRGAGDVYAARVGGGFPVAAAPAPCLIGDCQGSPTPGPDAILPGSELLTIPTRGATGMTLKKISRCVHSALRVSPSYSSRADLMKSELWIKYKTRSRKTHRIVRQYKRVQLVRKGTFGFNAKLSQKKFPKGTYRYKVRAVYKPTTANPKPVVVQRYSTFKKC